MKPVLAPLKRLVYQLLLLLGIYFVCRCSFVLINRNHFEGLTPGYFFKLCFFALRYDVSAILAINVLYIFLLFLPLSVWQMPRWQKALQWVFVATNIFALLFEVCDWAYFPYNFKRSTADVFNMLSHKGDFWLLLPRFFIDYWYVPLCAAVLIYLFIKLNNRVCRKTPIHNTPAFAMYWITPFWQAILLVVVLGLSVLGIRGGTQYIPINLRNALQVTDSRYVPIVLNTPFSIINTFQGEELEDLHFYTEQELDKYIQPKKQLQGRTFSNKNVVLIILESFSKEFTQLGGRKSYTPFLDSLMGHSLVCTQAYANALHSAEGVPSVICGVPSFMEESITTSAYGTDKITALPNVLRKKGYSTAFYHGGTNGTMSFDVFCSAAGYEKYYGRTEYNNEKDYDGNWGIWDEPFLQFFSKGITSMKQPFFATVFTLSSHPPYKVPDKYKNSLPKEKLPVYQTIAYTDLALREFFASAAKEEWFKNTLFVITPDHCSPMSGTKYYQYNLGAYAIPIIYFAPGDTALHGSYTNITQQLDILPSVLDYLGYDKPFYALGNSIFNKTEKRFVVNEISDSYQWLMDGNLLKTSDLKPKSMFAFPADSFCNKNILPVNKQAADSSYQYFKAFLQRYRSDLIHNKLTVD